VLWPWGLVSGEKILLSHGALSVTDRAIQFIRTLQVHDPQLAQASAVTPGKYEARVNRTVSYLALVDHTVALLLDPRGTLEETLAPLPHRFKTNPTRYRPGRQFPRKVRSHTRQVWFLRYAKRLIA
jgi:hypothetical protein